MKQKYKFITDNPKFMGIEFEIYECPVKYKVYMDGGQWGIPVTIQEGKFVSNSIKKDHQGYFEEIK